MTSEPTKVQRLPMRTAEGGGALVYCARRSSDVDVAACQSCGHCIGLSARDSYLVCSWHQPGAQPTEGQGHVMKRANPSESAHGPEVRSQQPRITTMTAGLSRFERRVVTASLDEHVFEVACRMRDEHVGCVVVVREGRPVGMLTDRDIVLRVVAEGLDARSVLVSSIVTYEAVTIQRTDGFETALRTMRDHGVRRVPIVDAEGRVTGIVAADDLVALLGAELSALGEAIAGNVDGSESR